MKNQQNLELGQHFLNDKDIIDLMVNSISKGAKVIEIGAGTGQVTQKLVKRASKVIAIEIDKRFYSALKALKRKSSNLEIIMDNVLDVNLKEVIDFKKNSIELIGSLPYQIIEPLFMKIIFLPFKSLTLLIPVSQIEENTTNKINILIKVFYHIKILAGVDEELFSPAPKTKSALVQLKPKTINEFKKSRFSWLLREFFFSAHKGTLVKNVLRESLIRYEVENKKTLTQNQAREVIEKLNLTDIILNKSFEQLNSKEIQELYESLKKIS